MNKSESVVVESNGLATEGKESGTLRQARHRSWKIWTAHPTSGEFEEGSSVEGDVAFVMQNVVAPLETVRLGKSFPSSEGGNGCRNQPSRITSGTSPA